MHTWPDVPPPLPGVPPAARIYIERGLVSCASRRCARRPASSVASAAAYEWCPLLALKKPTHWSPVGRLARA